MDFATELTLPPVDGLTEAELLALLTSHVRRLLDTERDWLLSKLYRLDVGERDIKAALAREADAAAALAHLILTRHRERMAARASHQPLPEPYNPELGDMSW